MPKAIITVGIPCSGKTTFAKEKCKDKSWVNVNRDDLRFSLTGSSGWGDYKFNKHIENMVTQVQRAIVKEAFNNNRNVIISDTNINPKTRSQWIDVLADIGFPEVEIKDFPIALEEAYKRDALRENGVGREVIYSMYQKFLEYKGRRVYTPDEYKPEAIIVDLDGTLADMTGIRTPFEWDKVINDNPRQEIIDMVLGYHTMCYEIIVCSGRDGVCESDSRQWMIKHNIPVDAFFIRKEGDTRKDTIIKEEIFWNQIADNYNVKAVIDDRPSVCRMWRELGLNVMQVADPHKEF